jgi:capsular polysaccharide biosynthesis protein
MAGAAEILSELVRRWWLVGVLVVAGGLAGIGYAVATPPTYTGNAYVVVVAQNPADNTSAVSYAQAYARIAAQADVLDAAAAASDGTATAAALRRQVRAASSPDTPIIEVTGSGRSPTEAANTANLVAGGLIATANRHGTDTRMTLTLLSRAAPPVDPTSPQPGLDLAVGAAVGLLLGGLAALSRADRASEPRFLAKLRGGAEPVQPVEVTQVAEPLLPLEPNFVQPPAIGLPTARERIKP